MPQVMIRRNLHISQLQASNLMDALSTILCHDGYPSLENGSPPAGKHIKVDMFSRSREHSACALADRENPSTTGIHMAFIVIGRVTRTSRLALGSVRDASKNIEEYVHLRRLPRRFVLKAHGPVSAVKLLGKIWIDDAPPPRGSLPLRRTPAG